MQTGDDFRMFWKRNRIFQYEVAQAAGIGETTLCKWLRDLQTKPDRLKRVSQATNEILKSRVTI